jgi:hypothetical protein
MKLERVRPMDWVAGLTGLVLLVLLFLPWYDLSDGSLNAWSAFRIVDLWLALVALLAIAIPIVTALRETPAVPLAVQGFTEALSWIAVLFALWRAIDQPSGPLDPTAIPWVALLVTLLLAIAVWRSIRDERAPGLKAPPATERMPGPPATAPAEPS